LVEPVVCIVKFPFDNVPLSPIAAGFQVVPVDGGVGLVTVTTVVLDALSECWSETEYVTVGVWATESVKFSVPSKVLSEVREPE